MAGGRRDDKHRLYWSSFDKVRPIRGNLAVKYIKDTPTPGTAKPRRCESISLDDVASQIVGALSDCSSRELVICIHGYQMAGQRSRSALFRSIVNSYKKNAVILFYSWPDGGRIDRPSDNVRRELFEANECGKSLYATLTKLIGVIRKHSDLGGVHLFVQSFGHHVLNGLLQASVNASPRKGLFDKAFLFAAESPADALHGNVTLCGWDENDKPRKFTYDTGLLAKLVKDTITVFVDECDGILMACRYVFEHDKRRLGACELCEYPTKFVPYNVTAVLSDEDDDDPGLRILDKNDKPKKRHSYWFGSESVRRYVKDAIG